MYFCGSAPVNSNLVTKFQLNGSIKARVLIPLQSWLEFQLAFQETPISMSHNKKHAWFKCVFLIMPGILFFHAVLWITHVLSFLSNNVRVLLCIDKLHFSPLPRSPLPEPIIFLCSFLQFNIYTRPWPVCCPCCSVIRGYCDLFLFSQTFNKLCWPK